jgi:DNA-binding NarL/FixJ family response regulator
MALRILLADDHTLVRQGLRKMLEEQPGWDVVGEAGEGRQAVQQAVDLSPDVAVMDVAMPLLNGVEATRQIARKAPRVKVLILSMHADEAYVAQIMKAGAAGYLLKDSADVDLIEAVTAVSQGRSFFSPAVARLMPERHWLPGHEPVDRFETLSEREREIFQLVAEGRSNKEIAALLFISVSTVETHRARIMEKLDIHSAAEIVLYAVRRGIVR